jgi:5-methylcytosine-specific restriction enzyme A
MNWLIDQIRAFYDPILFGGRNPKWPQIRRDYARLKPDCAICGSNKIEVHHCIPVNWDKSLELSWDNLISLCPDHHFLFGHLMDWHSFNKDVKMDAKLWSQKINQRPRKEGVGNYQFKQEKI